MEDSSRESVNWRKRRYLFDSKTWQSYDNSAKRLHCIELHRSHLLLLAFSVTLT